jgi:molybdopterin converting factor small subunit
MRFVRMKPGHGDVLLAEGDVEVAEEEQRLIEEFRRQLDEGMWAAVPTSDRSGRHEATMVRDFDEIPRDAEQVIFFPPAAGG